MIEEGLALYDLQNFMYDIVWVCDRGSNIKKALEKFTVVHCVAHRLNNVLQATFYQSEINKAKMEVAFGDYYIDSVDYEDDEMSGGVSEETEESCDDEQPSEQKNKSFSYLSTTSSRINPNTTISQLSPDAKRVLLTIVQCKQLVQYIKKVSFMLNYFIVK